MDNRGYLSYKLTNEPKSLGSGEWAKNNILTALHLSSIDCSLIKLNYPTIIKTSHLITRVTGLRFDQVLKKRKPFLMGPDQGSNLQIL